MFTNPNSIEISLDGTNYISLGQYLVNVKFGKHKEWSSDTGRTMSHKMKGSLGAIFDKITLYFGRLNDTQMETIAPYLDAEKQYVKFTHTDGTIKTMETYSGDWEVVYKKMKVGEAFNCALIARNPRT